MAVSYEEIVGDVAKVVEAFGVAILVGGGIGAFAIATVRLLRGAPETYSALRGSLGRVILLGLEVLIIGDIIRTIVVDPTIQSVGGLGLIVLIRIVRSFSLEVEIDGAWPWSRRRWARATGRSGLD